MYSWSYEDEWFEETNIAIKIKDYLLTKNYQIEKFNDDKKMRGHDIIAIKNGKKLIIEVKGFPSDKYVSGERKGQKKPTHPNLQAKHWFSEALMTLEMAKCKDNNIQIAFGLPEHQKYREHVEKLKYLLEMLDCNCYFVNQEGIIDNIKHID